VFAPAALFVLGAVFAWLHPRGTWQDGYEQGREEARDAEMGDLPELADWLGHTAPGQGAMDRDDAGPDVGRPDVRPGPAAVPVGLTRLPDWREQVRADLAPEALEGDERRPGTGEQWKILGYDQMPWAARMEIQVWNMFRHRHLEMEALADEVLAGPAWYKELTAASA
jgi:hypothetical protein